jgi:epoxyqueuosine reductase
MTLLGLALTSAVKARALELGFDGVAIGSAEPADHGPAFERWLDAGYHGSMTYLARTRAERVDPARLLPGARSVIAVALSYKPRDDALDGGERVARYARGRDYHDVMRPRLERLADDVRQAAGPGVLTRVAVDTSAVLERDLAARAGLGWIGKNTNLLDESLGSYFFIGVVLTTAALDHDAPVPDRCGTCRACLDACPTAAFTAPYVLDARRCISYLTIEHRGLIDESVRSGIGDWLFGCDVCQEVCPWNRKAQPTREATFAAAAPPGPLDALLGLDERAFRARFAGTALMRAKRSGLLRNAATVLGNRGAGRALGALRGAADDADPVVRETARWALGRIGRPASDSPDYMRPS